METENAAAAAAAAFTATSQLKEAVLGRPAPTWLGSVHTWGGVSPRLTYLPGSDQEHHLIPQALAALRHVDHVSLDLFPAEFDNISCSLFRPCL